MSRGKLAIGIDFGTESGRAVLVDCEDGRERGTRVYRYRNGVIDERLPAPHAHVALEPDWALQDPADYVRTLQETVPALLAEAGVDPADVIGVGIDFTACTMLPTLADGTPLVTGEKEGKGWIVLIHTTANADWSNLPLSGLFVEMLRRLVALSAGVATPSEATVLAPAETLDGYGLLG